MMDGNFDSILGLAPESYDEEITITGNGKSFTCKICTSVDTDVISSWQTKMQGREKALKAKNEIEVTVPIDVIRGREERFKGWKEGKDGKATFPLTKSEEITTASIIEVFVVEPSLTWAEAVVFGRINGSIALKIQKHIMNWLVKEGLIESKND